MAWGFWRSSGAIPLSKTVSGAADTERWTPGKDHAETHALPEIVHDSEPHNQALWLTVGIVVITLAGGGGFYLGRATVPAQATSDADDAGYDDTSAPAASAPAQQQNAAAPTSEAAASPRRHYSHPGELQGTAVIAAAKPASGNMFVHRMNSDVRAQPSYDAPVIKKEAKGAQVQLLALSDKWAEIQDGTLKGWMRASILKDTPPGEKRKKKADDSAE